MCRLLAYLGSPIVVNKLLYEPKNSLVNQSINAKEIEEPLNGDGFGIGWYVRDIDDDPVTFVSVNPAWSNRNLRKLAPKIQTECFVAHVRAASVGEVSESNCHPFQFRNLLMMHNGGVENFSLIKRKIRERLNDELYNWIKGQTDSEHLFAYLLNNLCSTAQASVTPESVMNAFEKTFADLKQMMHDSGIGEPAYLNMVMTDGNFFVGTRYVTDPQQEPLTLYHSEGGRYVVEDGISFMRAPEDDDHAVLVVSEKLTEEKHWTAIPPNHFVVVDDSLQVRVRPIRA
jgi:ergothioneine biosynthesis protein EgtC